MNIAVWRQQIDDALGEAFDKTAKILGLGYPGGPAVEKLAKQGDPKAVPLPRPLVGSGEPHFSFAGLKSAVLRAKESGKHADADIAASFQQAAVDCLVDRLRIALMIRILCQPWLLQAASLQTSIFETRWKSLQKVVRWALSHRRSLFAQTMQQ